MKPFADYGETITSGSMKTGEASIELTPEMFTLLSDGMYSDKITAVVRESICNARDAQVESGVNKPLELHLPTRIEPFFHIRDYGSGLSERQVLGYTEIVEGFCPETGKPVKTEKKVPGLYLRYGKSTKRDSNLQIGGFGIGCKAPLAYSDSFIVESYQKGIVKTYTVYKENGIPHVAKLSEKSTTEPNGLKVKVAVAVEDTDTFVTKVTKFLQFFDYPVTLTGKTVDYSIKKIIDTDSYFTVDVGYGSAGKVKACMGGVLYDVSDSYRGLLRSVVKDNMLVMKFNIGELAVAGSRETLSEDETTQNRLEAAVDKIIEDHFKEIEKTVSGSETPFEAFNLCRHFGLLTYSWRNRGWVVDSVAKDFKVCGETLETSLNNFKEVKVRLINPRKYHQDKKVDVCDVKNEPAILFIDRDTGYLKVAKQLGKSTEKAIALAFTDTELKGLKEYFGDNVEVFKAAEQYPILFPKGTTQKGKVRVAKTGIFDNNGKDLTEIDEGQKGWYVPFERNLCVMKGLPVGWGTFRCINNILQALVKEGKLDNSKLFFARKTGLRAIKKTELKELTWEQVVKFCKSCYTTKDMEDMIQCYAKPSYDNPAVDIHSGLDTLWELVKDDYPTWGKTTKDSTTKGFSFLSEAGIVELLEPDFFSKVDDLKQKYTVEKEKFLADYPLLSAIRHYWTLTDDVLKDIISFCEWKNGLNKAVSKNAA